LFFSFSKAQDDLVGTWEGTMSNKKLQIVIQENVDDKVKGYNILGKNKRPVKGTVKYIDRGGECLRGIYCTVILKEPGDDKWDGVFTLDFSFCPELDDNGEIIKSEANTPYCIGKWKANNGKLSGDFRLVKK
jgi:hypothetical protein